MKKYLFFLIAVLAGIPAFSQTNTFPSTGNVGVGTTSPSYNLHVVGDLAIDGNRLKFPSSISFSGSAAGQIWWDPTYGLSIRLASGSSNDMGIFTPAGDAIMLTPTGTRQVIFGGDISIPATKKLYLDGLSNTYISEVSADALNFVTGGTERIRILSTGEVGIGMTNPIFKLDVNGVFRSAGDAQINSINIGRGAGNVASNTAVGLGSFAVNTTGSSNTAIGAYTLAANTTGAGNIAIGHTALTANTTGVANTGIGYQALMANTTGAYNTSLGSGTLVNSTADYNTAMGHNALRSNLTGSSNVSVGANALYGNGTGVNNTGIGSQALVSNVSGSYNVAIGFKAGYSNLASNNVFLGSEAGYNETGSNKLYIDNSNTSSPLIYGDFSANTLSLNGDVGIGTAPSAQLHTTGTVRFAGLTNDNALTRVVVSDGSGNLSYRTASTIGNPNVWALGGNAIGPSSGYFIGTTTSEALVFKTNNSEALRITTGGQIAIGGPTIDPHTYLLAVGGNMIAEKIKLKAVGDWPDYVFEKKYQLLSLADVEKYIQQHRHLPDVPSAKDVADNGIDVGDSQALLLRKIEELTLYMIELDKKVNSLSAENEALKKQVNLLNR